MDAAPPVAYRRRVTVPDYLEVLATFPPPLTALLGGGLGLLFGSFLATIALRWPRSERVSRGRSRCDSCGRQLTAPELVPLASYLIAGGQCQTCGAPISPLHLAIEAACGLSGAYFAAVGLPLLAPLVWLLIVLIVFDALYLWLPDRLIVPLALLALLAPPMTEDLALPLRLAGGAAGFSALWLVAAIFRRATGRNGLGGGDPKLFGVIGLWTGPSSLPLLMVAACVIGFVDAGIRIGRGARHNEMKLPLGAYLALATIVLALLKPFGFPLAP